MADEAVETAEAPEAEAPDHGDDTWSESARAAVKAAREEAKKTREELKPYKELFSDPDTQLFKDAAAAYKAGDMDTVAGFLIRNTAALKGSDEKALVEFLEGGGDPEDFEPDDDDKPMTRAEVNRLLAEQEARFEKKSEKVQVEEIWTAAEGLGYQRGTKEFRRVLDLAAVDFKGDLGKAHQFIEDERQAVIDEYLAKKKAERDGTPKTVAGVAGTQKKRLSLEDGSARAAVEEFLAKQD